LKVTTRTVALIAACSLVAGAALAAFDLAEWKAGYGKKVVPEKGWRALYPMPHSGYFPKNDVKGARNWLVELGPLGVTTLMHDRTWKIYPAFESLFPDVLKGKNGELKANALEVVSVAPDGPAAGHLLVGDLIMEFNGEELKSAQEMFPGETVLVKDKRGLEIHTGHLIDEAEGRGVIEAKVMRPEKEGNGYATVDIEFEIPRIGSFDGRYNPEGEKAAVYRAMLAHRLALQQDEDGKWAGGGYVKHSLCTAICGLGLLADGDPAYNDNIRRAAHFVAYDANQPVWTFARGLHLLFLSEYYLKTRDKEVLPAMRRLYLLSCQNVLADGTAGHKLHPGYGGPGYIGLGSSLCCALAAARHTPLGSDGSVEHLLRKMLLRAEDLAPTGFIPYSRDYGKNVDFSQVKLDDIKGQSASAGSGLYAVASIMAGGPEHLTRVFKMRYGNPPYGDVDAGHASAVLPFVFGALAVNACGDKALEEHFRVFLWKLTTHRRFNGFITANTNNLELHGGDAVLGYPFWRTGGYLLILNAHKRNLFMTCNPKFKSEKPMPSTPSGHMDDAFRRFVLRNWNTAHTLLGDKTPADMMKSLARLRDMKNGSDLDTRIWQFMQDDALNAARAILAIKGLEETRRGYLAEMVLGIGFHCVMDSDRRLARRDGKKAEGLKEGRDRVYLWAEAYTPMSIFQRLVPGEWKKTDHPAAKQLTPVGSIVVTDPSRAYLKEPLTIKPGKMIRIANVQSTRGKESPPRECPSFIAPEKAKFTFEAAVDYMVGDLHVKYSRPVEIEPFTRHRRFHNVRKVWVEGKLARDYFEWSFQVLLPSGQTLDCTDQSESGVGWPVIPAGTPGRFLVSAGDQWEGLVHEIEIANPWYGTVKPSNVTCEGDFEGKGGILIDKDTETVIAIGNKGPLVVHYEFDKPTELSGFVRRGSGSLKVDAWIKEKWQSFGAPDRSAMYRIPMTTSSRFRVEVSSGGRISELHPLRCPEHGQIARETGQAVP
jgi:hypothetical protein